MDSPLTLSALLLIIFPTILYALNTTTTTAKARIVSCNKQAQCPNTHYCNRKQRVCMLKRSVNSTCADDVQCTGGKCSGGVCRQPCRSESNCSLTKEYCTTKNFCLSKHCGGCTRNAQCANNNCSFFRCEKSTCAAALTALQKQ